MNPIMKLLPIFPAFLCGLLVWGGLIGSSQGLAGSLQVFIIGVVGWVVVLVTEGGR